MLTRREVIEKAAKAAAIIPAAVVVPSLLSQDGVIPNCVYTKKSPSGVDGPTPNVIVCGDSCANEGMVGRPPNCYYPQYTLLNQNLAYTTSAVRNQTTHAVLGRTITQTQWNVFQSYSRAITAHLSMAQTTISDKLRIQVIAAMIYQWPTSQQVSQVQGWASRNGYDPAAVGGLVAGSPPINSYSDPTLHALINALPNTQGMDNLSSWIDTTTNNVVVPQTGLCAYTNPSQLVATGTAMVLIGSGITLFSAGLGPAAVPVAAVGDLIQGLGYAAAVVGEMCVY